MDNRVDNETRFLILVMLLSKYSSNDKKLDLDDINKYLEENGCKKLSRSTLITHINKIEKLQNLQLWNDFFGELVRDKKGRKNAFGIANLLEESEVRILSDLIYASKALSEKESDKLIKKINRLINIYSIKNTKNKVIDRRNIKTESNIGPNISNIIEAIKLKKKISFNYSYYDVNNRLVPKVDKQRNVKRYVVTPIDIFFKKDFYYLVLKKDNKEGYANYRIDKISNIVILEADSDKEVINFDLVEHISSSVYMFTGKVHKIELEVNNKFRGVIIDELGRDIKIYPNEKEGIMKVDFNSTIDEGLISWILQLGSACKVRYPKVLAEKIQEEAKKILDLYTNEVSHK